MLAEPFEETLHLLTQLAVSLRDGGSSSTANPTTTTSSSTTDPWLLTVFRLVCFFWCGVRVLSLLLTGTRFPRVFEGSVQGVQGCAFPEGSAHPDPLGGKRGGQMSFWFCGFPCCAVEGFRLDSRASRTRAPTQETADQFRSSGPVVTMFTVPKTGGPRAVKRSGRDQGHHS